MRSLPEVVQLNRSGGPLRLLAFEPDFYPVKTKRKISHKIVTAHFSAKTIQFINDLQKHFLRFFTPMFVERMEVLNTVTNSKLELSTFPDSTNTETPRKLVFSLTCVSVCLGEKVCQWIS